MDNLKIPFLNKFDTKMIQKFDTTSNIKQMRMIILFIQFKNFYYVYGSCGTPL